MVLIRTLVVFSDMYEQWTTFHSLKLITVCSVAALPRPVYHSPSSITDRVFHYMDTV